MTIKKMTKANARIINQAAMEALKQVAEKHGLQLSEGRGGYDPSGGTFDKKYTFTIPTEDGIPADFRRLASMFHMEPEDFGRTFITHQGEYAICGIAPRSPKYPILAKCVKSGKTFKFTERVVKTLKGEQQ